MRTVYFILDSNNYIDGGIAFSPMENAIELELPKDHEIFKGDANAFKYVDGELIFDEERNQQLTEETEKLSIEDMNILALFELAQQIEDLKGGK